MRINYTAIILAAGYSSRMGRFKPLLPIAGKRAVVQVIDRFRAAGIEDILVVTGHNAAELTRRLLPHPVRTVYNPDHESGMYSSIRAGCAALDEQADAFFIAPVDTPLFDPSTVKWLAQDYAAYGKGIVLPSHQRKCGHPTLISAKYAAEILAGQPPGGLRDLLRAHRADTHFCAVDDPGILLDMDDMEGYGTLLQYCATR